MAKKAAATDKKKEKSFIERVHAARDRASHPHLDPINAATFESDRNLALAKAGGLAAYQKYLTDVRAAKARRKGASLAFERNVQAQARQALGDLGAFSGAALRITQQMNQTNFWSQALDHMRTALGAGPVSAKQMWTELQQNDQYKSALRGHGLSDDIASAVTEAISNFDANLVMHRGKVAIETRVAGEGQPRRLSLKAPAGRPTSIADLLRRSQFEKVVSAFTNQEPVYLEAVSAGRVLDYEPCDLFAYGAVAGRQRMAEHVRKLEDTGLATYQGNDPLTFFVAALAIGLFLGVVGATILYLCDHPTEEVEQPDWVCTAGFVMVFLAIIILGALTAIAIIDGVAFLAVAGIAFGLLLPDLLEHFPTYTPPEAGAA
jgi:hypothetical protein